MNNKESLFGLIISAGFTCTAIVACSGEMPSASQDPREMLAPTTTIIIDNGVQTVIGPPNCRPGSTAEVQLAISGGDAGNSLDGQATCDGRIVAGPVNAIDPGNGQQGSNTAGGLQAGGPAGCDESYIPVPGGARPSTRSVVCKFF